MTFEDRELIDAQFFGNRMLPLLRQAFTGNPELAFTVRQTRRHKNLFYIPHIKRAIFVRKQLALDVITCKDPMDLENCDVIIVYNDDYYKIISKAAFCSYAGITKQEDLEYVVSLSFEKKVPLSGNLFVEHLREVLKMSVSKTQNREEVVINPLQIRIDSYFSFETQEGHQIEFKIRDHKLEIEVTWQCDVGTEDSKPSLRWIYGEANPRFAAPIRTQIEDAIKKGIFVIHP